MANADDLRTLQNTLTGEADDRTLPTAEMLGAYLNPTPAVTPRVAVMYSGQAAMIAGQPYEMEEKHGAAASSDPKGYRSQTAQQWFQEKKQASMERLSQTQYASSEALEIAILSEQERINNLDAGAAGPVADEVAYTTQAAPLGDPTIIAEKAYELALATEMKTLTDGLSMGEWVANFAGYLLPFGEAADVQDIANQVRKNPQLAVVAGEDLESFIDNWQTLPPQRRTELLPYLSDAILKATSTLGYTQNELKASQFLSAFLEFDPAETLRKQQFEDVAFSAFDVIPSTGVVKAMKPAEKVLVRNTVAKAVDEALNESHAAKVAADAGDINSSAAHTLAATLDDVTAEGLGTTRVDAAMSALPLETSTWFKRTVDDDNLPTAVAERMNKIASEANGFTSTLSEGNGLIRQGILNPAERIQVHKFWNDDMKAMGEDYLTQNLQMDNLRIVKEGKDGFTYSYTLKDLNVPTTPDGKEKLVLRQGEVKFSLNQVTGNFSATVNDPVAQNVFAQRSLSPATWSKRGETGDFNFEVTRQFVGDDVSTAYQTKVEQGLQWAWEPVSKVQQKNIRDMVENVIIAGDEFVNESGQTAGRTFTPTELAAGVETPMGTIRLTDPKAVEAYYRVRMYADSMFQLEDSVIKRELELGGFTEVRLHALPRDLEDGSVVRNVRDASDTIAKPYEDVTAALSSIRNKRGQGVWDDRAGATVDITEDYVRRAYDEGDVIVRLRSDWNTKGTGELDGSGEFVQYARVPKHKVKAALPENVLQYRDGYFPKISEAEFFVTRVQKLYARGRDGLQRSEALRGFNSLADARTFREQQVARYIREKGVSPEQANEVFPEVKAAVDLTPAERLEGAVARHAGLYHGVRSKDEILFGLSGQKMERVNPIEAFQRHAAHLGNFFNMNEVRIARERRWLNTVREEFPEVEVRGFDNTAIPTGTKKAQAIEAMRTQIREWNNIPTREEAVFETGVQKLHDWALYGVRRLGFADKESVKSLNWLKHKNGYAALKTAVMHGLLGTFNPAQWYTQASALAVAMSKLPAQAPAMLKAVPQMAILDTITNTKGLEEAITIMKRGGVLSEAAEANYRAWRRTGLQEAVFNNSDLARVSSHGLGYTAKTIRSLDFLSLLPYRAGELAARRATFTAEFGAWSKRTGKTTPSEDELTEILDQVHKDLLTLGPANKAWWQGGANAGSIRQALGVATQFMQVGTKTLELALKNEGRGGLTSAQRLRILMGQATLFGAAGVPFAAWVVQGIHNWVGSGGADPVVVDAVNQGIVGVAGNWAMGAFDTDESLDEYADRILNGGYQPTLQISERFGLGAQTTEMVKEWFTNEDPLLVKMAGPAGGGVLGRIYEGLGEAYVVASADFTDYQELDVSQYELALSVLGQAMGEVPSTLRNVLKAQLMSNHQRVVNSSGKLQIAKDFYPSEIIGTYLGFQTVDEVQTRLLQQEERAVQDSINAYAAVRTNIAHKAIYHMSLDEKQTEALAYALQVLDTSVGPYIGSKGRDTYVERILNVREQSNKEQQIQKFIERTAPEKLSNDAIMDSKTLNSERPLVQPFSQWLNRKEAD